MKKQALYWEKQATGHLPQLTCLLCPNFCIIKENEHGKCRKRINIKGVLYAENYGLTTSLNLDPMTKKPLYHFYPTEKVLSLGANSCNLTCKFCQNYTISQYDCSVKQITPNELLVLCQKNFIKHVAFTYTEPFTWYEYVLDASKLLRKNDISVVLVTNAYVNIEPLTELIPFISAMNIDLKSFSDRFYVEICGGKLQPVLDNIKFCHNKTHLEITLLLIEGLNDDYNKLCSLFSFIADIDKNIPLHISKYFPRYLLNTKETSTKTILNAVDLAKKYLNYVYAGNVY